ncbi:hypothetical protein [Oscillatoria acuminata]|uniref:DUF1186 domain-containing protein n=1 Tax=Oscillatoria acuminata PCC 6304 TaxID=56110 RepID=K9THS1_9CYAN|nr:hypothetical protein [Oscillatoria acuminata]AFY82090.1 hypothetical protein Oscil6304_2471 [Oscillatoria acuminata PCC 6304]
MILQDYQPPVSQLLTFGDARDIALENNYIEQIGFTEEHIPDLIRMAIDPELNWAYSDTLEVWAPIHAWRSLGQLRAAAAVKPLLSLMDELKDSDWYTDEMPTVLAQIGPVTLPDLIAYLANPHYNSHQRAIITESIALIGKQYPEYRDECVKILTRRLADYKSNPNELNGWIVCNLIDLKAVESASVIEAGFAADAINPFIPGDWNEVQVNLGLKTREELPEPDNTIRQNWLEAMHEYSQKHPEINSPGFGTGLAKNQTPANPKKKKKKKRK